MTSKHENHITDSNTNNANHLFVVVSVILVFGKGFFITLLERQNRSCYIFTTASNI